MRRVQQRYLPAHYPGRRLLGVIIPTAEQALAGSAGKGLYRIGVLATQGTVASGAYVRELKKIDSRVRVYQNAAPLLVPLIENNEKYLAAPFIKKYLRPLLRQKVDAVILGCTHYPLFKREIRDAAPGVRIISQDELIARKLRSYLEWHPEIDRRLSKNGTAKLLITDATKAARWHIKKWFGENAVVRKIIL